jgi:two-component system sensor histidine kinase YesM
MEQKISTLTNSNLSYIKTNIESDIEYYSEILYRIDSDDNITQDEIEIKDGSVLNRESAKIELTDYLASYADIRDEVSDITYVNSSMETVFYDKKNMSVNNYLWDSYSSEEQKQIYNRIHNAGKVVIFNTKRYTYNNEDNYLYNIGIKAWDLKTGEDLGIIIISIDEKYLQNICNIEAGNETDSSVKEYSFVVDDKGSIVSFSNNNYIGTTIKKGSGQNSYDVEGLLKTTSLNEKDGIIINSAPIDNTNWSIINLIDKSSMFAEINSLWKFTLEITLIIIIVCIGLIMAFSNKFYKSINDIVVEIKKAKKGDFSAHIKLNRESELIFISNEFNEMIIKVNGLVENLKNQNAYIYEISNKRREAEINAIVSQINPHFLYNTLDCINWMAIKNENFEVSKMIGNLADILRYSIPTINDQVTIYEAVEWLEKYLYLHQVRFNNSFRVEFNINDEILGCKIYKLLLQPIVENAVLHGFKGCDSGKLLAIKMDIFQENFLRIEISDNGIGISKRILDHILDDKSGRGIGIGNVYERLKIYYKDSADMTVFSEENIGTKVTIIIPIIY